MSATEVSLSTKHQIVVPKDAREALGLSPGDKLLIVTLGKRVIMVRKPESFTAATKGLAEGIYEDGYLERERDSWRD